MALPRLGALGGGVGEIFVLIPLPGRGGGRDPRPLLLDRKLGWGLFHDFL